MIKVIALDLDGTTLNDAKEIPIETVATLKKAREMGVKVVFDTGRPPISTRAFLEALGLSGSERDYCITFNGGRVATCADEVLLNSCLSYADLSMIHEWTRKEDIPLDVIAETDCYTVEYERPSQLHYVNNTLTFHTVTFDEVPKDAVFNKVILSGEPEILDRALKRVPSNLTEAYEWVKTRDILLEIMPKGVTKATGLAFLCEKLAVKPDEVLAMGDEDNDIPMLSWAGVSIAPANANDRAKAAAKHLSNLTNNENAVAVAIEEYVLHES
ncbi:MAG: Cof-type HAD-IIB family hydrolase [Streptococcaceae bacterium]|jgi:Cof subfamily protein (haloacid dehalogenase superfamily)|nr:Cof-type HAD-IIB family hydrolase [Streptococcaceae bacterium]